jgi:hypothetical protein
MRIANGVACSRGIRNIRDKPRIELTKIREGGNAARILAVMRDCGLTSPGFACCQAFRQTAPIPGNTVAVCTKLGVIPPRRNLYHWKPLSDRGEEAQTQPQAGM